MTSFQGLIDLAEPLLARAAAVAEQLRQVAQLKEQLAGEMKVQREATEGA